MKVLHVYKTALPASYGGVETFIDTLCRGTDRLGVENMVLTLHPSPASKPIDMSGYRVYQAKEDLFFASTAFSISAFHLFRQLASTADIIHYHYPNPFGDLLGLMSSVKRPSIMTYHSDIVRQKFLRYLYQPLQQSFLKTMDAIVATSPNYVLSSKTLRAYTNQVSVIPCAINPSVYQDCDQARLQYWRSRLPERFFLFVGVPRYYKGLSVAIEAIAGTDMQLVIGGAGGVEQALKKQAKSLGLDNVYFLGFVDEADKLALLHLCYGFVFPSHLRSEAFGTALLEAAVVGKPMISCEIGTGTTYVNLANKTGINITPTSASELKKAMGYLLDNPEKASWMGKNAKQRVMDLFTSEAQAKAYNELYQGVL
ncbi:MAG: glycosyl transferase family 1 [Legionellales bacterium]|nr:glycosyl transferase family 1 [Legionellales bacterium]